MDVEGRIEVMRRHKSERMTLDLQSQARRSCAMCEDDEISRIVVKVDAERVVEEKSVRPEEV